MVLRAVNSAARRRLRARAARTACQHVARASAFDRPLRLMRRPRPGWSRYRTLATYEPNSRLKRDLAVLPQPQGPHATTSVDRFATQSRTSWGRNRTLLPILRPGGPVPALRQQ